MRKIYMSRNLIKKTIMSLPYSIIVGILTVKTMDMLNYINMDILVINVFSHVDLANIMYITPILTFIIYPIYLSYMLSNYLVEDLDNNACYVFTRTGKKNRWLSLKCLNLFLYVLIYYMLHFIIVMAIKSV